MSRYATIIKGLLALIVIAYLGYLGFKWTVMRVYVGPDEVLIVTSKFGHEPNPGDATVEDGGGYKGILREPRGPGRYFLNPVMYKTEIIQQVSLSAGDPTRWEFDSDGNLLNPESVAPMVGLVVLREGKTAPPGQVVVDAGVKGIQRQVLTPGVYKINTYHMNVEPHPAVIVPPGSVGVVTRLVEDGGAFLGIPLLDDGTPAPGQPVDAQKTLKDKRGILRDVLQPGIYYLNPRMVNVTVVPVGYDVITLDYAKERGDSFGPREGSSTKRTRSVSGVDAISFGTKDGYMAQVDFTVVWGRSPAQAPAIVKNIGSVTKVQQNVIEPSMRAVCQTEGAKVTAQELIKGETRSKFQAGLEVALEEHFKSRDLHVLLALIRNITIKDKDGRDQTEGLLATIQRANIEVEKNLTNKQKTETATIKAQYDQAIKQVDVSRESITAETSIKVADLMAEGQKKAAELGAERDLEVASIQQQIAELEAQRTEIMGKAKADVERLKNEAEAKGAKLLVDALGSPAAYNRYIFAKNFEPTELRLIFAGPGTFWTDLRNFQDIGSAKLLQPKDAGNK